MVLMGYNGVRRVLKGGEGLGGKGWGNGAPNGEGLLVGTPMATFQLY